MLSKCKSFVIVLGEFPNCGNDGLFYTILSLFSPGGQKPTYLLNIATSPPELSAEIELCLKTYHSNSKKITFI